MRRTVIRDGVGRDYHCGSGFANDQGITSVGGGIEAVAQGREHGADVDLLGWPGELIAPLAAADALHQASATQQAHQLVHMGMAQTLLLGDLGGRHGALLPPRHLEQATKPVLFLRC